MSLEIEIFANRFGKAAFRILIGSLGGGLGVDVFDSIVKKESGNVDKRIAKIEAARENLLEALTAIDEIKAAAQEHKNELTSIQRSVVEIGKERDKLTADKNLLLQMTSAERDRLREMLGVPTRLQATLTWVGTFFFGAITSWMLTYAYDSRIKALFDAWSTQVGG
jgi:VIT1/CCC1 family predicted Fe2+/Mn2+ transporter